MAANDNKTSIRDSDSEENEFEGFLASDLLNLCDEDLSSNIESETKANMSDFCLVVMRTSQTVVVMKKYLLLKGVKLTIWMIMVGVVI